MADIDKKQDPTPPKALLTVVEAFDDYEKGDQIFDADEAKAAQASHPHFVRRLP